VSCSPNSKRTSTGYAQHRYIQKASARLHKPVHRQQPAEKPMLSFASVDRRTNRARESAHLKNLVGAPHVQRPDVLAPDLHGLRVPPDLHRSCIPFTIPSVTPAFPILSFFLIPCSRRSSSRGSHPSCACSSSVAAQGFGLAVARERSWGLM
jgi:hypothetical protein